MPGRALVMLVEGVERNEGCEKTSEGDPAVSIFVSKVSQHAGRGRRRRERRPSSSPRLGNIDRIEEEAASASTAEPGLKERREGMEEESLRKILAHETEIEAELLFDAYTFPPPKRAGMLKWRPSDAFLETGWEDEGQLANQSTRTLKFMLAGISAGAVSRTMTAPLDRVKILMQVRSWRRRRRRREEEETRGGGDERRRRSRRRRRREEEEEEDWGEV
eukprot:756072-Hanusia_phi.AAC.1